MKPRSADIITGKYLEDGELYSGAPGMSGKSAVVTLMQINPVKIIVSISEQYYPLIKNGMKVRVTADVYPDKNFEGTIFRVHPTIDPMSRSFRAEVRIQQRQRAASPGDVCKGIISTWARRKPFVVPSSSVLMQEGTNERFIFVAEAMASPSGYVLSWDRGSMTALRLQSGDLKEGENLVVDGQARLTDGHKLEIANDD